jgi:hypothetical protein
MILPIRSDYVGSEVLTAMVMKSSVIWDTTPCNPLKPTEVSKELRTEVTVPPKRWFTFNRLHGVIFQMIELFKM